MLTAEKRVQLRDDIRSNILENTSIKDTELAKKIAFEWVKKITA